MLTARAYTLRQKSRLAISLSWIAGYANVVVLIYTGMMISHVTGNLTHFGQLLVDRKWALALLTISMPLCFLLGAMLSGVCVQLATRMHRRSIYIVPMALQAGLLAVLSIVIAIQDSGAIIKGSRAAELAFYLTIALGSVAMGMQNATITSISGAVVRTTHLTGVMTDIGTEIVAFALWLRDKTRRRGLSRWKRVALGVVRQPDAHKLALLISIVGSFGFGVLVGTIVHDYMPRLGLVPPVLFLLWIVFIDWREPIADVKAVDHLSDPELRSLGLEPSMLPRGVGIYRVAPSMSGLKHQAPDFMAWAGELPREMRVCILSIAHGVHLDDDACLSLKLAADSLMEMDRQLLLAGIASDDYDALDRNGVTETIPMQNLCSDLEFAIARAMTITEPSAARSV
jgi:uncharacterized membrane protein YoaK (UPF0700 family)